MRMVTLNHPLICAFTRWVYRLGMLLFCLFLSASFLRASVVTRYAYDEAGNQILQVDALNRTNTYVYDVMGRRVSHTLPGNQVERFSYDLNGNLVYTTNFNGVVITTGMTC